MSASPACAEKLELVTLLEEKARRQKTNKLARYRPYRKQAEFHRAGATFRERLLRAGNQLGKTIAGGAEAAMHLTGRYPDWWDGRRWDRPIVAWVAGITGESTRETVQRVLFGRPGQRGTGWIPAECILHVARATGVKDLIDYAEIRHESGGVSLVFVKSFEKGREKWQGDTVDLVWFDEEPPEDIYSEGLTRTNATGGLVWLTFTPLKGMSKVVQRFLKEQNPDRCDTNMTIYDAEHYSPEERARIIASYPAHEREARANGVPILGSGRIFPAAEELVKVKAFAIPAHWRRIGGIDFGWDHPTAAVDMAWDMEADVLYVTKAYREREQTPVIHAAALKPWGDGLPWAWPHDGLQHDKGSGEQLAEQYRKHGLKMLPERATFEDGSNGVEAGLLEMLDRMLTGRWKVFDHLEDWFDEFRLYHREDGKVVKVMDDLMSASRYAMMMRRHAAVVGRSPFSRKLNYASGSVV